ncbi:MAG: MBL fold metallo-hydrolase [Eubacteriales bacterium]|nr:MBL fold metallo-hydrolase [Eubacteriales bacterium]
MAKLTKFSDLTPVSCPDPWFKVYRLLPGVTAIFEPYHFQEVISYLIEGTDRALLFDSGMGIGDIRSVVSSLTDKPVTLVNSHSHFDHVGGNHLFGETHLLNVPDCVHRLENGFSLPAGDENLSPKSLSYPGELDFDLSRLSVKPCRVIPVNEGDVFKLGNRKLRVIATPGHSRDSLMLCDDDNHLLFTGDTVYPAPLYAFLEGSEMVRVYADTIKSMVRQFASYTLCCSHNNPLWSGDALSEISDAFEAVLDGKISGTAGEGHIQYSFGDFSIVI